MPPKRSRGKPALSRVPFLDGVNGDSDYSSSGESGSQGLCFGEHLAPVPQHNRAETPPEAEGAGLRACWESALREAHRWHGQDANLPLCYHPAFYQFVLLHKRFFLLSLLLITCALCSPRILAFCWSGVMCLALPSSDRGLVLLNDAAIQTVNDNYKRGLSGNDFTALPSCIAILAFKVFVTKSLSLSDCTIQ